MKIKIYKKHYMEDLGICLPYLIIRCKNITAEEYEKIHAESEFAAYKYEIL